MDFGHSRMNCAFQYYESLITNFVILFFSDYYNNKNVFFTFFHPEHPNGNVRMTKKALQGDVPASCGLILSSKAIIISFFTLNYNNGTGYFSF